MANVKRKSTVTKDMWLNARTRSGLSQSAAAKVIGKSIRTVQYYENGKINPTDSDYNALLRAALDKLSTL